MRIDPLKVDVGRVAEVMSINYAERRSALPVQVGFCPFCGSERRNRCGGCHRTLEPLWSHCPGCGQKRSLPTARSAL
ncbi:MAG TPA: hypothetical protein PKD69_02770 [Elusimicrobiota bacterium]|nr:hypothetical protein [Elusimicrobiota bacterium]